MESEGHPRGAEGGRHGSSRGHQSNRGERRDRDAFRERRRSRSPHHRGSRHESDSYSSSRDYRAREREDRYSGRDSRRDDRNWDRDRYDRSGGGGGGDRGSRRDGRRGDDEEPRRGGGRERDGHDRGPRRGPRGGRDRDDFGGGGGGGARKSNSPPPKRREPTPDLTDVVSVLKRKRRMPQWDIKPPGYESVTAEQAKLSGMFPLPGAPRQQVVDPSRLQSLINQPGTASKATLKPSNSRQAKRLFLQNVPSSASEDDVIGFFNLQLNGLNVIDVVDPCISCQISGDKKIAMVEFKNPTDATVAFAMDGISMDASHGAASNGSSAGSQLEITRPKDYISAGEDEATAEGTPSSVVVATPDKLVITNIVPNLDEDQAKEFVSTFGSLKSFVLVKDKSTEESRGIAFFEYQDSSVTSIAIEGLNGMELGGQKLNIKRAGSGFSQASGMDMSVNAMSMLAGTTSTDLLEGRVLQLLNMVTAEELINDEDYEEIIEDVKEECEKYGKILDVKVPRPSMGSRQSAGVGKIFIKYDTVDGARKALQALAGRKFSDRTVVTTFFPEESFDVNGW